MHIPPPFSRSEGAHLFPVDQGLPFLVGVKQADGNAAEGMTFQRRKNRQREGDLMSLVGEVLMNQMHRRRYLDGAGMTLSNPSSEAPLSDGSITSTSYSDSFAYRYPYITTCGAAFAAGALMASTGFLTWSALRRFSGTTSLPGPNSVTGGMNSAVWARRMDDLERRIVAQVQSSNRDRRLDSENMRREIISRPAGPAANEAGTSLEPLLTQLRDRLDTANRDRRNELYLFRSELMGQLGVLEDKMKPAVRLPRTQTSQTAGAKGAKGAKDKTALLANAPIAPFVDEARLGQVLRSAVEDVLHAKFGSDETLGKQVTIPAAAIKDIKSSPKIAPTTQPPNLAVPADTVSDSKQPVSKAEADRAALYDGIQATKERYQSALDSMPQHPAGTPADEVLHRLDEASRTAKVKTVGETRAKQPIESVELPNTSYQATSPEATSTLSSSQPGSTPSFRSKFPLNPLDTIAEQVTKDAKAKSMPPPREATTFSPRLSIDESGKWSFVITPPPDGEVRGAGWRTAKVFQSTSYSQHRQGMGFVLSSSTSGHTVHNGIQIFVYPEFDIVRLDGQLWRCSRMGDGRWVIKERIGDVSSPEWDGVGFAKE